jgi:hypothetical protein
MLRGLVSRELAAEMLDVTKSLVDGQDVGMVETAKAGIEPFRSLAFGREMERNAQRLCDRARLGGEEVSLRFHHKRAMVLPPSSTALSLAFHQDATEEGADRGGQVNLWLALDEVPPERGAMRFVTGAHREGPLGIVLGPDDEVDLLGRYPRLLEHYELSPPFHYHPGDATVHQGYTPHGTPPNATSEPRWSYLWGYVPADTRYINGNAIRPGIDRHEANDDEFPIVVA